MLVVCHLRLDMIMLQVLCTHCYQVIFIGIKQRRLVDGLGI